MSPLILIGLGIIGLYVLYRWRKGPPAFDWRRYDANNDGVISGGEISTAMEDHNAGIITDEQFQEVMAHVGEPPPPEEPPVEPPPEEPPPSPPLPPPSPGPGEAVFYGRMLEKDGVTGIPGVSVTWRNGSAEVSTPAKTAITDAQGYYAVRLKALPWGGSYSGTWFRITASKSGFNTYRNRYWFEPYQWYMKYDLLFGVYRERR